MSPDFLRRHLHRSERYVNFSRLGVLVFLTLLWIVQAGIKPDFVGSLIFTINLGTLLAGWFYSIGVLIFLQGHPIPKGLPWVSGSLDLLLVTLGLTSQTFSPFLIFPGENISGNAFYGLYFLIISFSVLRMNPLQSIILSVSSAVLYGFSAFYLSPLERYPAYFIINEIAKIVFLLLAGAVTSAVARFIRRTIEESLANEAKARESDKKLTHIAEKLPGAVLQLQRLGDGRLLVLYVSPGILDLLGLTEIQAYGKPEFFEQFLGTETSRWMLDSLGTQPGKELSWTQEIPLEREGQPTRWVQAGISARKEEGGVVTFSTVLLDISDRKRMEIQLQEAHRAAEESSRAKSVFLATMSHELRTPLNGIMGLTEWLLNSEKQAHQVKPLETILQSTENLQGVIDDLLDFSRLEAGRLQVQAELFSLRELVGDVITFLQPQAEKKGLQLEQHLPEEFPDHISADPKRIRQILLNLMENGIKYTLSGWVRLTGSFAYFPEGVMISLHVEDSGLGIPERERESIFEMFTQVEMGKTRIFGGVGLGLAICRSLADLLDGSITVESQVGEGSLFTFTFPAGLPVAHDRPEEAQAVHKPLKKMMILLVEDNLVNQDVQKRLLEKLGMKVLVASGGLEALEILHHIPVDLVLLDWQMPVIDGVETAKRIRTEIPGGDTLPLIALTGHAFPTDRAILMGAGFNGYLSKPVRLKDFRSILETI